jgi:hypothetical protein
MKKILLIIALLFAIPIYAETRLTIGGEVQLGSDIESYNSFASIELNFNLYFWKCKNSVYGGYTTWFVMNWNEFSGHPFRDIYHVGNRFSIYGFFIDVKHFCNHPVVSNRKWQSNFWGENITAISIGYEFEFTIM